MTAGGRRCAVALRRPATRVAHGAASGAAGFTLLEVMISLAILAIGLVALSDLNGGAVQMQVYARRSTQATLLLRGKMLDLEEQLQKDGFSDFDDEKRGTFEDDGAPGYAWTAEILKPDIQLDPSQLMGMLGLGGSGSGSSAGGAAGLGAAASSLLGSQSGLGAALGQAAGGLAGVGGGAAALAGGGPFAGMIQGQAKTFIETLKKSVREVRITVFWKDGASERSISASQQIVILPESVGKAGQEGVPGVANGGVGAVPGAVNGQFPGTFGGNGAAGGAFGGAGPVQPNLPPLGGVR